jgi:uncharacterized protein YndB with AHSA1/START domain
MTDVELQPATQAIVVDEVFPHAPETLWRTLTNGDLITRWMMAPSGFKPVEGTRFTFKTTPAGAWDGIINCQVLEVVPNERFAYSWTGGDKGNEGYGSPLETIVTFFLSKLESGTRLRLVHSGFVMPVNAVAYRNMSEGWKTIVPRITPIADEQE